MFGLEPDGGRTAGSHILDTDSGHQIDLDAPDSQEVRHEDIGAALSKVCRFLGPKPPAYVRLSLQMSRSERARLGESKRCRRCKAEKPITDFYAHQATRDRRSPYCTTCQKFLARASLVKNQYGLTQSALKKLQTEQAGRCAICDEVPTLLHVDHDHDTRQARALLCPRCNQLLGRAQDRIDRLEAAIEYLKRYGKQ